MEAKRPFSQIDWLSTPEPVREYIIYLERLIGQMQQRLDAVEKRTEKLEARTRMNSQNSSKPPSSDSPFNKQKKKTKKSKTKYKTAYQINVITEPKVIQVQKTILGKQKLKLTPISKLKKGAFYLPPNLKLSSDIPPNERLFYKD